MPNRFDAWKVGNIIKLYPFRWLKPKRPRHLPPQPAAVARRLTTENSRVSLFTILSSLVTVILAPKATSSWLASGDSGGK